MDDILSLIDASCKSWKTVRSYIFENAEVHSKLQHYQTCLRHMCFASMHGEAEIIACSVCGKQKALISEGSSTSHSSVTYIPIAPRIHSMIEKEGKYVDVWLVPPTAMHTRLVILVGADMRQTYRYAANVKRCS